MKHLTIFALLTLALLPSGLIACSDNGEKGDAMDAGQIIDPQDGSALPPDAWTVDPADASTGDGALPEPGPDAGDAAVPVVDAEWELPALTDTSLEDPEIGRADVRVTGDAAGMRAYALSTTAELRQPDSGPGISNPRTFSERADAPVLRSGNALFDALFALALEEVRENSVDSISDGAFNHGQGVDCGGCFETGRNWHYVWTRDTAFAVDLGLAAIDPTRSRRSLEFKLSERRGSGDLQIVQDTGTGGSWPVSTDRVSWALGARELLGWLGGEERTAFRDKAYAAIANTLEHDRATIYDARDGLYTGEQSFLDWREQTYPAWTKGDPAQIAMSKSLSTNLLHLNAMRLAAELAAEKGEADQAERYGQWASALRGAIRAHFLLQDGRLSTFSTNALDPAPTEQFDALSIAFAVDQAVLTSEEAAAAVAAYPHTGKGPPTIWPQQQATPIYHNRSFWPFVTGYWIEAARRVGNDRAVSFGIWSLVRGAALNLTNMENFELMSGKAHFSDEDPAMSGPVVNSQRQLWSVAGYLSMVQSTLFGIEVGQGGLRVRPYIPRHVRHAIFGSAQVLALKGLTWRGKKIDIEITLPPAASSGPLEGAYDIASAALNGQNIADLDAFVTAEDLRAEGNTFAIALKAPASPDGAAWTFIPPAEIFAEGGWKKLFGPKAPTIPELGVFLDNGQVKVTFAAGESDAGAIVHDVFRDGVRVAEGLDGATTSWIDPDAADHAHRTRCYSVQSRFKGSNNASQHARAGCYWGEWKTDSWRIQEVEPSDFRFAGGGLSDEHECQHLGNGWGDGGHFVEVDATAAFDGDHFVQLVYANGTSALDTGVTCGVKQVQVFEAEGAEPIAEGFLAMPALGNGQWSTWKESTLFRVRMDKGKRYRIRIGSDGDVPWRAINMSAFQHFANYTGNGGNGGTGGELNHVNIAKIKLLALGQ